MGGRVARGAEARRRKAPDALIFIVIITCVWVGWQILRNTVVQIAPPDLALRLGPDSPTVLTRAAVDALVAGRNEEAGRLAERSLARRPFNARALRVAGLVAARQGDEAAADRMLTLAGNWSLRDDPAHSWLVGQRLRQGRSASALAHADTLMRRRPELRPQYFDLMTQAALTNDGQAQAAMVGLLRRDPPWRRSYFRYAVRRRDSLAVAAAAAMALKSGEGRVTVEERSILYSALAREGLIDPLRTLRGALEGADRPVLTAGDFSDGGGAAPFGWRLPSAAGVLSEIAPEGDAGQPALYAVISDIKGRAVAEQLVMLTPGSWRLTGRFRVEQGELNGRLAWTLTCTPGRSRPVATGPLPAASHRTWTRFSSVLEVPAGGCAAQWLRLSALPRDRRATVEIWVDDVVLTPQA